MCRAGHRPGAGGQEQEGPHRSSPAQLVSRGQIVAASREPRRTLTSVSVFVDHRLAPSFYFVAYFYHQGFPVANSLLINVQPGDCEGKVTAAGGVTGGG